MCGIAGIYRFDNQPVDAAALDALTAPLARRGPDDAGSFRAGPLGLGFRRLAILDLSEAGHQPFRSADGSLALIFNGEIYNFRDLRAELEQRGHHFRSESDSEVLLAAYAEWDVGCLQRLSGMWAFAIWDARRRRLFCARDRFGIKPFYYHQNPERLVFASEIKALFADPETPNRPNDRRIHDFLLYGYLDHTPETCFAGIQQLPPAHFLLIGEGRQPRIERYWALDPARRLEMSESQATEAFRELLTDSVRRHLQSDVPVGTCLSGGLDSSTIVGLISQLLQAGGLDRTSLGERQKTFSACYDDPQVDERRYIDAVIQQTGAASYRVFPSGAGLRDDIDQLIWHQEEPVGSTSIYAQWCVMRLAREHGVTVLLDGQGGDEVLAGYHTYFGTYFASLLRRGQLRRLRHELAAYERRHGRSALPLLRGALGSALPPALRQLLRQVVPHRPPAWLGPRLRDGGYGWPAPESPFRDPLSRQLHEFLVAQNLPALLRYEDRSSMAFSIEARVPFLDEQLVAFLFALPAEHKLRDGQTKVVLRRAMRGILPETVRARQDKLGFATPGDTWLRDDLAPLVDDVLGSASLHQRGYFDPAALRAIWSRHRRGEANQGVLLWRALHLELWLRRFVDTRPRGAVSN